MGRECPCGSGKRKRWGNKETGRVCCVDCKKDDMIDLDAPKKCGCPKNAARSFGFPNGKAICCSSCKQDGMVNLKSRKCGCDEAKVPTFGFPTDQRATCCSSCKKNGMVNIVDRKCVCGRSTPCFAMPGEKTPVCCSKCKTEGMIDVKNKLCSCGSSRPSYGTKETKQPTACVQCKTEDMIRLTNHECPCGKIACFGFPQDCTGKFCSQCKEPGMVDVLNKKCYCGSVRPSFGYAHDQIVRSCVKCQEPGMILLTLGPKCKSAFCNTYAPDKDKRYDGYCARCFIYLFPEQPNAKNIKIKERHVTDNVKEWVASDDIFDQNLVAFDKKVSGPCASGKRPDVLMDLLTHVIVIEVDEQSHARYDCACENKRMMEIFQDCGSRPIIFIRFNPDEYVDHQGTRQQSCFRYDKTVEAPAIWSTKLWKTRLEILENRILHHAKQIPSQEVSIEHLFYDGFV